MATQFVLFVKRFIILTVIWLSIRIYSQNLEIGFYPEHMIRWAPVYAIFGLGIWSIYSVLWGALTFNDCPEAAAEVRREIIEAQEYMSKRKIL